MEIDRIKSIKSRAGSIKIGEIEIIRTDASCLILDQPILACLSCACSSWDTKDVPSDNLQNCISGAVTWGWRGKDKIVHAAGAVIVWSAGVASLDIVWTQHADQCSVTKIHLKALVITAALESIHQLIGGSTTCAISGNVEASIAIAVTRPADQLIISVLADLTWGVAVFSCVISVGEGSRAAKYNNEQLWNVIKAVGVEHWDYIKGVEGLHELDIE